MTGVLSRTIRTGKRIHHTAVFPRREVPLWTTSLLKPFSTTSTGQAAEKPRLLPTSGFETIQADQPVEEEELPDYKADRFYPVKLGDIFQDRYQTLAKLGSGSSSTSWLARDLK